MAIIGAEKIQHPPRGLEYISNVSVLRSVVAERNFL